MGTIDTMKFENLNFSMFGLVLAWFVWIWSQNVRFLQENAMVLKGIKWSWKNHIWPYYDRIACILIKIGVMVLKEIQDPLLLPCDSRVKQKWLNLQGIWPNWLPTVGHTLAKTHVYNLKYTSLRTYWLTNLYLSVSTVLCLILDSPEPRLGPVVCTKILSSCSYPPAQWCNCEHG